MDKYDADLGLLDDFDEMIDDDELEDIVREVPRFPRRVPLWISVPLAVMAVGFLVVELYFIGVLITTREVTTDCQYTTSTDGSSVTFFRPAAAESCTLELVVTYRREEGWKAQPTHPRK